MATNLTLTNAYLNNLPQPTIYGGSTSLFDFLASAVLQVALGTGLGLVEVGLTAGNTYTSINTGGTLNAALTAGQSITLVSSIYTQILTVSANASIGATTISVTSFTANNSYVAFQTSFITTPAVTDTQLNAERLRVPFSLGQTGSAHGEFDWTVYFSPSQANNFIIGEMGLFDDSSSNVANSGILLARAPFSLGSGQKSALQSLQFKVSMIPTSTY